jgi:hypothetical protein
VIIDRFDRRKVMVLCDIGRASLLVMLPFVENIAGLLLISLGLEILTLLWGPAQAASVPNLVPEEQLSSANSLSLAASYGTFPIASIIFSLLAGLATVLGDLDVISALKVDQEVSCADLRRDDVPRFPAQSSGASPSRATTRTRSASTGPRPSRSRRGCSSSAARRSLCHVGARLRPHRRGRGDPARPSFAQEVLDGGSAPRRAHDCASASPRHRCRHAAVAVGRLPRITVFCSR